MLILRLTQARDQEIATIVATAGGPDKVAGQVTMQGDTFILIRDEGVDQTLLTPLADLPGVTDAVSLDTPYLLSSRRVTASRSRIGVGKELVLGGEEFVVLAGPCAVESADQVETIARLVREQGARGLRGGAYKPRTSPFNFQGQGKAGLEQLRQAGQKASLPTISEVIDPLYLDEVVAHVDILQVGMRNALNYSLLKAIGRHPEQPPVLLKCGIGTTLPEFLSAVDYVLAGGNPNVILCLRGSVGLTNGNRAVLNIANLPTLRSMTHLPIIVDPSHAAGRRELVPAMAAAAMAAGADGLLVEVHHHPEDALSDGRQSLTPTQFSTLMHRLRQLAPVLGRTMIAGPIPESPTSHPFTDLGLEAPPQK